MKNLDRTRSGILANVKDLVKSAWRNAIHGMLPMAKNNNEIDKPRIRKGYFGAPFSYCGSLRALDRPSLADVEVEDDVKETQAYGDL